LSIIAALGVKLFEFILGVNRYNSQTMRCTKSNLTPMYALTLRLLIFSLFFAPVVCQAQSANLEQVQEWKKEADILYYSYQYSAAVLAYAKIVENAPPSLLSQKLEAAIYKANALQNMQKNGEAMAILEQIHTETVSNKKADAYALSLAWLAKAAYYYNFRQKDSLEITLKLADEAIAKVPEQPLYFPQKAFFYFTKQQYLAEITQQIERKTALLAAVDYADKMQGTDDALRGVIYERWANIAFVTEADEDLIKLLARVKNLLKNPYYAPYKRKEAGYLNRKMILMGLSGDSIKFELAAQECLAFIKANKLEETFAYAEYLQFFALIKKDIRVNYPVARQTYREFMLLANRRPDIIHQAVYLSVSLNYAYTLVDNHFVPASLDTGLTILENIWQQCLAPKYRGAAWGEYPDMSQVGVRIASLQDCSAILQALTYTYNKCYQQKGEEKYKIALFNSLEAAETLLFSTLKTTSNEKQRNFLAYAIDELFIRNAIIYIDLYVKNPNLDYLRKLWQIAQQCNSRTSRYRQTEEKALLTAQVDKQLSANYLDAKKELENALLGLSIAQKDNNGVETAARSKRVEIAVQKTATSKELITKQYPLFEKMVTNLDWVKMEEIRPLLKQSGLILHYSGREESYQILLTSDTVIFYRLHMQRERTGRKLVDSLNLFLNNPPQDNAVENLYKEQFERLLIRAKDSFFRQAAYLQQQKIQHIIIVPDELTAVIPYEILLTQGDNKNKSYTQWAWALKQFKFQYLPSLSFWLQSREQSGKNPSNGKLLAFAPTYEGGVKNNLRSPELKQTRDNLAELTGAKKELKNLADYYYGDYYEGQEANESLFKSKSKSAYAIIHFAMHGLLDEQVPELSSLAFSETADTTEDNFLTAHEIARLPQRSQLVVLSACETAKGKLQVGEGVMSLAQHFLYAGATAVVATRWQVNDQTTAFIMQNFYKYLYEGKTINAALRDAQLDYLTQAKGYAAHPFYWSPFINVGDTNKTVYIAAKSWAIKYYLIGAGALLLGLGIVWRRLAKKE